MFCCIKLLIGKAILVWADWWMGRVGILELVNLNSEEIHNL